MAASLLKKYIDEHYEEFMNLLVRKFHTFKLSLIIDPVEKKPVHHMAIDSIFDIAWFAFSKLITEDASYVSLEDDNYFDDFDEDEKANKMLPVARSAETI